MENSANAGMLPTVSMPISKTRALPAGEIEPDRNITQRRADTTNQSKNNPPKRPLPPANSLTPNQRGLTSSEEWERMSGRLNAVMEAAAVSRSNGLPNSSNLLAMMASSLTGEGSEASDSQIFSDNCEQDSNADLQTKIQ